MKKLSGKRVLAALLAVLMAMSLFTVSGFGDTATTPSLGDINADESINASDALLALQHSVKLITLTEEEFEVADVDGNDLVNATDALYILQHSVKLIDRFPAETDSPDPGPVNPGPGEEPELMVRVTDSPYNAKGDGVTNDRAAIQAAIDDVHAAGDGTVLLDAGKTFVTGNIWLKSNVDLHFEDGAKLKQTSDPNAFVELQEDGTYAPFKMTYGHVVYPDREWDVGSCYNYPFLYGRNIKNFKVTGNGIIEMVRGKGCEDTLHICPVVLYEVDQFELSGFTVQKYNAWAVNCKVTTNGLIKGITIKDATDSAADGIGIVCSQNIRVTECNLTTSDDGIKVSSTYGDPRRGPWIDELTPIPCKNIEIDNNHCVVTWDATKAFAFFVWGSSYPDQTQVEISDVYIHDNYFKTMGIWTGNWNLETNKFDHNGSTSPIKNIRFENNEIGTVQGNFYSVPISDIYGFDCMVSMLNGDFSDGDVYWVSREGGSAGASKDGYGYIDALDQKDAALYQGLKLVKEAVYEFKADVKTSGQPVRLFVKDQITGELIASQECTATDWETVALQIHVPKDGNYHVGIERGEAQSGFAYIDNATLIGEADAAEIPEGENILSTQKPDLMNAGDGIHNMLGVAFSTKVDGVITHVRFYASAQESGNRIIGFWNEDTGEMLLDDYIDWNITSGFEGWKYYKLPNPVHVTAGTAYIVGISCGTFGKYAKGTGQMATAFENGNLVTYDQSGRWRDIQNFEIAMPEHTGPSHYFRDIVFVPSEFQVNKVLDAIDALPDTVDLSDKEAVEAARAAYDALADTQKALIENIDKLTSAEARIAQLEDEARIAAENKAKSDAVIEAIQALPDTITLSDKTAVEAARTAYNALTDAQKALVGDISRLIAAEAKIEELLEEARANAENKEKADAVTATIGALPESIELGDKEAVEDARAAYDGLTEEQKALVTNLSKLTDAEARIAQLEEEARIAAENKAKADAVIAAIDALPAVDAVTLEDAESVQAARNAYDALTDEQKALVNNVAELTEVEERITQLNEAKGISIYTTQTPANPNYTFGGVRLFLGTRFSTKVDGTVTKVRLYTSSKEEGTHYVGLWDYETATLVSAELYEWNITAGTEGWQEFVLPESVALTAGKQYVVAVSAGPNKYGAETPSAQTVFPIENDYIVTDTAKSSMWADMSTNGNNMPNKTSGEYYFRDIVFVPGGESTPENPDPEDPAPEVESVSIYTTQTPVNPNHSFGGPRLFLGTRFTAKVDGTVTKVRLYTGSKEEGTHYVGLWDYETATLVSAQLYEWNITAGTEGWQEFTLPEAVSLTAGKQYVVAVSAGPNAYGAETPSAQTVFPIGNDYIITDESKSSMWADMASNGKNMPNNTSGEYYFRDIVFVPAS